MSRKRTAVLAGAVLLGGALVGLLWMHRERTENRLTVENRSGQPLIFFRVTTAGQAITFSDVPAGGEVSGVFRIKSDDHFAVEGRLADGKRIGGNFGYVTGGMCGQRVQFVIRPGGRIEFTQSGGIGPYCLSPSPGRSPDFAITASR